MWAFVMISYIRHQILIFGFPAKPKHPKRIHAFAIHGRLMIQIDIRIIFKDQDYQGGGAGRTGQER